MTVLHPGEGRSFAMGVDRFVVKVGPEDTSGLMAMVESTVTPGVPGPPPHVHTDGLQEIWYVLEGELEFMVGADTIRAPAGSVAHVPAGVVHTFANPGGTTARFVGIFLPATGLTMIEEVSKAFPDGPGEPDVAEMMRVFAAHGVEVVGPPAP
jgi:quercetin dioxygenase-like cupin family protein